MRGTLGIDIGTSSVKVLLVSSEGEVLAYGAAPVRRATPKSGFVETDPEEWWTAVGSALRSASIGGVSGASIDAIGLSGNMSALLLVGRDGRTLRPAILLADPRGGEEIALLEKGVEERIARQGGNKPSQAFTLAKLLWVRRHEPEIYRRIAQAQSAKDWIRARLTGSSETEPTDGGNYLLLDGEAAQWDGELLDALGLDRSLLPPLVRPFDRVGELTAAAADSLGLPAGVPVVAGAADMACAAIGSGTLAEGEAAMSLGTAAPIILPVEEVDPRLRGHFTFHPHAIPRRRYALASILSGGRSYEWFARLFKAVDNRPPDLRSVDEWSAGAEIGSGGVLFLPFLTGGASPDWHAAARAGWLGITAATGRPELGRAILEGVAFNSRECIELFASSRRPVGRIVVSGGGARSEIWTSIIADVTGIPVEVLACGEASALGAALLATIGAGLHDTIEDAIERMVKRKRSVAPDGRRHERYSALFDYYRAAKRRVAEVDDEYERLVKRGTA